MISLNATFDLPIGDAGIIALLGYAVVFFGLILLMLVVMALGRAFSIKKGSKVPTPAVSEPAAPATPAVIPTADPNAAAPGSSGKLKLHNVPPKTAAMLMAIVANKLNKPLNELRFISIKEVEE